MGKASEIWKEIKPKIGEMLAAVNDIETRAEKAQEEAYQRGLSDAWEAARKIGSNSMCSLKEMGFKFEPQSVHYNPTWYVVQTCSASEAIEKIRQYEHGEKIVKGDVVRIKSAPEVEILVTYADEEYVGGIALTEVDDSCEIGDQFTDIIIHKVEKTGRHYEIAEVLKEMREDAPT